MLTTIVFIVVTLYVVAFICSSETIKAMLGLALVVAVLAFAFNRSTESGFISITVLVTLLGMAIFFDLLEKRRQKSIALEEEST